MYAAIDTHEFVKSFVQASKPPKTATKEVQKQAVEKAEMQAEIIVKTLSEAQQFNVKNLATKADIENLRSATKADIKNLRDNTKADIKNLRDNTQADIKTLKESMDKMFYKIISCTGGMLVVAVGVITWLDKILN